ncbi:SDR family NAD(P)-dependent oxidoreductase [Nocardia aobensis]|uniref:SDR family NAD(P)-dependent oxidoreductase n=1 Tax=Nocardia aobensis TaxID=257277 RepID=UPI000686163D|nr:SDR family NAD(P)-dependent oxidoreductase [Nocardia aobensis]
MPHERGAKREAPLVETKEEQVDTEKYGPWAVIAGGSEGVGAEFAAQLAEQGLNLVLLARKEAPLEATAEKCRAYGVTVRTLSVDLLAADAFERIRQVTDDLVVGLFIYNAGANTYGHEFVTGDLDRFQAVIDLNITAQLKLVQHFGALMRERRRGGILLAGSLSGFLGSAQISIYSAVKAFCRIFAEGLWLEMQDHNVDVLELVLGLTRTPAMARAGLKMDAPGLLISEPRDVAAQGLANLANGPVVVVKEWEAATEKNSGHNRAELLIEARDSAKKLLPPPTE